MFNCRSHADFIRNLMYFWSNSLQEGAQLLFYEGKPPQGDKQFKLWVQTKLEERGPQMMKMITRMVEDSTADIARMQNHDYQRTN